MILQVFIGVRHIPVGPLTPELEQLAMAASAGDSKSHEDSEVAERSAAGPTQAFSGRGHTLNSNTSLLLSSESRARARLETLREQEALLQQQVSAGTIVSCDSHLTHIGRYEL